MVFVAGTNLDGIHAAGSAKYAHDHYGLAQAASFVVHLELIHFADLLPHPR